MKNIKNKDILIFVLFTLIVGFMVVLTTEGNKKVKIVNSKMENQLKYIDTLNEDIKILYEDNVAMEKEILALNSEIATLKNKIDELENKLKQHTASNKQAPKKNESVSINRSSSGRTMTFEATAYSNDPITATGTVPKVGRTIAVDPKVIPLGSKVYIEGMGTFIAEDTGGAIKGKIIDIYMGSKDECRNWGRRNVEIKIL